MNDNNNSYPSWAKSSVPTVLYTCGVVFLIAGITLGGIKLNLSHELGLGDDWYSLVLYSLFGLLAFCLCLGLGKIVAFLDPARSAKISFADDDDSEESDDEE